MVVSAADREAALAAAQALSLRLTPLVEAGVIGGFESPARYLPPLCRAARAPGEPAAPRRACANACSRRSPGFPVSAARLQPFLLDVEQARTAPALTRADLEGTSFARAEEALLVRECRGLVGAAAGVGGGLGRAVRRRRRTPCARR